MITRENYEIYFLDYHEGRLSKELQKELYTFLDQNPDLKSEFDAFDFLTVPVETVSFTGKSDLKKFDDEDLDKPKIIADLSIVYPNKRELKRGAVVIPLWTRVAAAAVIVLGIMFYVIGPTKNDSQIAVTNPKPAEQKLPESVVAPQKSVPVANTPIVTSNSPAAVTKKAAKQKEQQAEPEEIKLAEAVPVDNLKADPTSPSTPTEKVEEAKPDFNVFTDEELVEIAKPSMQHEENVAHKTPALGKVLKTAHSLFGVNSDYSADHEKEVFALGSVEFSRNKK